MLRAWRVDCSTAATKTDGARGGVGGARRSERAVFASRSVVHGERQTTAEVSPSCWVISPAVGAAGCGGVAIEYTLEFQYATMRRALPGLSDARIVATVAGVVSRWFVDLPIAIAAAPGLAP